MLERIGFRTGFLVHQKFLSEEISASRKTEGKKWFFSLRAEGLTWTSDVCRFYTGLEPENVYTIAHSFDKEIAEMNDADTG